MTRRDVITLAQDGDLLRKLEAEERAGWPDLPDPESRSVTLGEAEQMAVLARIVALLAENLGYRTITEPCVAPYWAAA